MSIKQLCMLSAALVAPAAAVSQTPPPADPEEILVTGERVERPLQETASSVVVLNEASLDALAGADRLDQALALVPNLQFGSGSQGPTIRGQDTTGVLQDLASFLGGARPRATLQVDGRAVGFNEYLFGVAPLWDIERVEVFRSPQTTTQGRHSIAGAIFVHSKDPAWTWEAGGRALRGSGGRWQGSAVVSGPLVQSQLAFRVAGDVRRGRPSSRIADRIEEVDPDRDDFSLLRAKLLAEPHKLPGARIEVIFAHVRSEMPQIAGLRRPFRKRRDPLDGYGVFRTNVDSLTGRIDYALAPRLGSSLTVSAGNSFIRRFAPPGLGETRIDARDVSLEAILKWRPGGKLDMVGGVHRLTARLDQQINLTALIGEGAFQDEQGGTGLFGDATWRALPRLTLTAGLRYQHDVQRRRGEVGRGGTAILLDYDEGFDAWLPKLSAAYEFSDSLTGGILVQRAYNPGGVTISIDTASEDRFDAETLWATEAFLRARLPDHGLQIAINLFQNDIRDAQRVSTRTVTRPDGPTVIAADIANVPNARTRGSEIELRWQPISRLRLRAGAGLLHTRIGRSNGVPSFLAGKAFQRSPRFSAAGEIEWQPTAALSLSGQIRHNGRYYSEDRNRAELRIGRSTIASVRAELNVGGASLFGYVRNLFGAFDLTLLYDSNLATAVEPRELGAGIEFKF